MTASTDAMAAANEAAAAAHLPANPEEALRLLARWDRAPADARLAASYAQALATRFVAHLLLGNREAALATAREMRTSWSVDSLRSAAYWLLRYPHDADPLARLIQGESSCGRAGCRHSAIIDLALVAIGRGQSPVDRVDVARVFAARRPDSSALGLALARELRAAGRATEALEVLQGHQDPAVRRLAATMHYQQGQWADALAHLPAGDRLRWFAAFALTPDAAPNPETSLPGDHVAAALWMERHERWKDAAHAWTAAGRRREAVEASLCGGHAPSDVRADLAPRWIWRRYALTGRDAPDIGPDDSEARRHKEIGVAQSYLTALKAGRKSEMSPAAADPLGMRPLLLAIRRSEEDPAGMQNRILHLRPPDDPWEVIQELPALPSTAPAEGYEERLAAWRRWVAAQPSHRLGASADRAAARVRRALAAREQIAVDDLIQAGPSLGAGERSLAATRLPADLGPRLREGFGCAMDATVLAATIAEAPREALVCAASAAGTTTLPDRDRLRAGEIAGSIAAQLAARGSVAEGASKLAIEEVQQSLADVVVPETALSPVAAYEMELGWLRLLWSGKGAVGTAPVIATHMSPQGEPGAGRSRAKLARFYGPLGRAWIIFEAGRPQAALQLAEGLDGSTAGRTEALATFRAAVARQLAEIGRIQEAVEALRGAGGEAASAAASVAKAVVERLADSDLDRAIALLEQVVSVAPRDVTTRVQLARCLNRRVNRRPEGPGSLDADIADLQRASALDPDNPTIRSNLIGSRLMRAASFAERSPQRALEELETAMRGAMDVTSMRTMASNVAMRIGVSFAERRDRQAMRACVRLALQYDPDNDMAQEIWMKIR